MKKRILSMLLCIIMCAAMLPFSAMATDVEQLEMPEDGGEGIAPYTVDPALAEASVTLNGDTVYYATIEEALAAAQKAENKGCLLKLENNAVFDTEIQIKGGTFTLDLNGKTLTASGPYLGIYIYGTDLTITDSSEDQSGTIGAADGGNNIIIKDISIGKLTINSGNFLNCTMNIGKSELYVSGGNIDKGSKLNLEGNTNTVQLTGGVYNTITLGDTPARKLESIVSRGYWYQVAGLWQKNVNAVNTITSVSVVPTPFYVDDLTYTGNTTPGSSVTLKSAVHNLDRATIEKFMAYTGGALFVTLNDGENETRPSFTMNTATGEFLMTFTGEKAGTYTITFTVYKDEITSIGNIGYREDRSITITFAECTHANIDANGYCPDCGKQMAAAVIGAPTKYYETLKAALDDAQTQTHGASVMLLSDCTLDYYQVKAGNAINLDLNGHSLAGTNDSDLTTLTIAKGTVYLTNSGSTGKCTKGIMVLGETADDAECTIESGDYSSVNLSRGKLYVNGGTIDALETVNEDSLYLSGGKFRKINLWSSGTKTLKDALWLSADLIYRSTAATSEGYYEFLSEEAMGAKSAANVEVVHIPFTVSDITATPDSGSVGDEVTLRFTVEQFTNDTVEEDLYVDGVKLERIGIETVDTQKSTSIYTFKAKNSSHAVKLEAHTANKSYLVTKTLDLTFGKCSHEGTIDPNSGKCKNCGETMAAYVVATASKDDTSKRKFYESFDDAYKAAITAVQTEDTHLRILKDVELTADAHTGAAPAGTAVKTLEVYVRGYTVTAKDTYFFDAEGYDLVFTGTEGGTIKGGGVDGFVIRSKNDITFTSTIYSIENTYDSEDPTIVATGSGTIHVSGSGNAGNLGYIYLENFTNEESSISGGAFNKLYLCGNMTFKPGGAIYVEGQTLVVDGKMTIEAGTNILFAGDVLFTKDTTRTDGKGTGGWAELSGGSFRGRLAIVDNDSAKAQKLGDLLADGCEYYVGGVYRKDAPELTELTGSNSAYITVGGTHVHDYGTTGTCSCGVKAEAELTVGGTHTAYGDFASMLAQGRTLKDDVTVGLLKDLTVSEHIHLNNVETDAANLTLDLNGHTLSGTNDGLGIAVFSTGTMSVKLKNGTFNVRVTARNGSDLKLLSGTYRFVDCPIGTNYGDLLADDTLGYKVVSTGIWESKNDIKKLTHSTSFNEPRTVGTLPITAFTVAQSTKSCYYGDTVTLTASATISEGYKNAAITYKWYMTGSGIDGTKLLGETATVAVTPDTGVYRVYCVVTCAGQTIESDYMGLAVSQLRIGEDAVTVEPITKEYDGTRNNDASTVKVSITASNGLTLKQGVDFEVTEAKFWPSAVGTNLKGYVTLNMLNKNVVYTGDNSRKNFDNGTITKNTTPIVKEVNLNDIYNGKADTYTYDLADYLPQLTDPAKLGDITDYYITVLDKLKVEYIPDSTSVTCTKDGKLSVPVAKVDTKDIKLVVSITVKVTCKNYKDVTITLNLNSKNRAELTGQPVLSSTELPYTEPLKNITFKNSTMKDGNTDVHGTFSWVNPDSVPAGTGDVTMNWTFTPDDSSYDVAQGTVTITVVQAELTGEPELSGTTITYGDAVSSITFTGSTLKRGTKEVGGTFKWDEPDVKPNAGTYRAAWTFEPTDKGYADKHGTVTITVKRAALTTQPTELVIYNDWADLYEAALPAIPGEMGTDGNVTLGSVTVTAPGYYTDGAIFDLSECKLILPIEKNVTDAEGYAGKAEVKLQSNNYETTLTLNLTARNRVAPGIGLTADKTFLYGGGTIQLTKDLGRLPAGAQVTLKVTGAKGGTATVTETAAGYSLELPNKTDTYTVELSFAGSREFTAEMATVAIMVNYRPDYIVPVPGANPTQPGGGTGTGEGEESGSGTGTGDTPFGDVDDKDWFKDDVKYVYDNGLMGGLTATEFGPYVSTTRGMIVTILWRMDGEPAPKGACPFSDVGKGTYYEQAIAWAAENGIVDGFGGGVFGPDAPVTREQLAAILYRYAVYHGLSAVTLSDNLAAFADKDSISAYAVPALQWMVGQGLIKGSGGMLDPGGCATRAQLAAIIHRFCLLGK